MLPLLVRRPPGGLLVPLAAGVIAVASATALAGCDAVTDPPARSFRVASVVFERVDLAGPAGRGWDTGQGDPHYDGRTEPDVYVVFGADGGPGDRTAVPISLNQYALPYEYGLGSFINLDASRPLRVELHDCDRRVDGQGCTVSELMASWTGDPQTVKGEARWTFSNEKYAVTLVLSNWTYE